jgi:hypothetical protein
VKVHDSEGLANRTGPESCVNGREAVREALTGDRAGQPLSGVKLVRSADALEKAEGNTGWRVNASASPAPRRLRPWHVRMPPAREPGELRLRPGSRSWGYIGKT